MPYSEHIEHTDLILACEDFSNEEFSNFHCFFSYGEVMSFLNNFTEEEAYDEKVF
jgi:hypothetical protein